MMTMSNQAQASATTAVPAITVKDIVVSFEQKDVLKGITWEVPTDAITTLIGPNGCGKSTLLKCITGSVKPISGTIYINGQKASSYSPRTLAQRMVIFAAVAGSTARYGGGRAYLLWALSSSKLVAQYGR